MGLGAEVHLSTELADYHRTMVMATQCIGGAQILQHRTDRVAQKQIDGFN